MANLITQHDILAVLENGCPHNIRPFRNGGLCGSCAADVRRFVLERLGLHRER